MDGNLSDMPNSDILETRARLDLNKLQAYTNNENP
jgi:hypothetical protein